MEPTNVVSRQFRNEKNSDGLPNDVFSHHLKIGWPGCGGSVCRSGGRIPGYSEIIYQCLKPDVHGVVRVVRHWDSPRKSILWARNRQIFLHIAFEEAQNFLTSGRRVYRIWVVFYMLKQLVAECRQAEHVVFLLGPFDWGPGLDGNVTGSKNFAHWGNFHDLGVGVEAFICDGVPSGVFPFVYEVLLLEGVLFGQVSNRKGGKTLMLTQTCWAARW
jgi:hypothetical protein